ncbi:uncharacterized protein F54H12.2-like [Lineus longissimus]|uniref:uncharacterized protein F54H12.2-like n=1 Tax=Lineus longissimus TaxID=88925 RepID=UPI00315DFF5C
MALVHENSAPSTKSELDIFQLPPTQIAVDLAQWVEFRPLNTLTDGGPIEFVVKGEPDNYLDLAHTQLYIKLRVIKKDGTNLTQETVDADGNKTAGSKVAPVNLLLHSLFSQADVSFNDRLISPSSNTYPYRGYLETLLSYGAEAKGTHLGQALWIKDEAGKFDVNDPWADAPNSGLVKRYNSIKGSKTLELLGRVHTDAFSLQKLLLNNIDVKLKFIRQSDAFALMSADEDPSYKINIMEAALYVKRVHVAPTIQLAHNRALEKANAKYHLTKTDVKVINIQAGNRTVTKDNVFLGELPKRVILGMVNDAAMSGNFKLNPFHMRHNHITYLSTSINGQQIPSQPLKPDFDKGEYARAYMSLFSANGNLYRDQGIDISRGEYAEGYTLFAFDISPSIGEDSLSLIRKGNFRIEMHFAEALTETVNLLLYAEFDDVFEVTKERQILVDG